MLKLCIISNKIDAFIRAYDGNRYLALSGVEIFYLIYNRVRYFIG